MHKRKGNETHQKIYSAIKQLLEQKNAAEISVQDICQCAGIGVGTFYHYYPSKNAAIYDISNPIDEYFELKVAPELDGKTPLEQLRFFFYHQAMFMIQFVLANGSQEPLNYLIMSQQHFSPKIVLLTRCFMILFPTVIFIPIGFQNILMKRLRNICFIYPAEL